MKIKIKDIINWKVFFILLAMCLISTVLVLPYSLALASNGVSFSLNTLLLSLALNLVQFAIAVFLGLYFSKRSGLGLPILQGALEGKNVSKELKAILPISIALGVFAGVLIVLLSIPFDKLIPELQDAEISIPAWKALLASFYGGIGEEVLLRLFLVSLLVWLCSIIKKTEDGRPADFWFWLSIILASIVFGLGHLPATSQIIPLNAAVVTRAIVLNGVAGIVFGWLYWKKGLESAMIAHFSADIVLHVITPFAASLFA